MYYHMDINDKPLPVGTVLKPNQGKEWHELVDAYLESQRPNNMLSRQKAVFLVDDVWVLPEVGMPDNGWIYAVEPSGAPQHHDVGWFIQLYHEFEGMRTMAEVKDHLEFNPDAETYAANYWNGVDFGQGAWEYLVPNAKIVKVMGTLQDMLNSEINEIKGRAGI
jgi:hypothetical protein